MNLQKITRRYKIEFTTPLNLDIRDFESAEAALSEVRAQADLAQVVSIRRVHCPFCLSTWTVAAKQFLLTDIRNHMRDFHRVERNTDCAQIVAEMAEGE